MSSEIAPAKAVSAHRTLSAAAFPELQATSAGAGRLDLQLILGLDVFTMSSVSLSAAEQMFSAQIRGASLWVSTRSLREAPVLACESVQPALSLRPDHRSLHRAFTLFVRGSAAHQLELADLGAGLRALSREENPVNWTRAAALIPPSARQRRRRAAASRASRDTGAWT